MFENRKRPKKQQNDDLFAQMLSRQVDAFISDDSNHKKAIKRNSFYSEIEKTLRTQKGGGSVSIDPLIKGGSLSPDSQNNDVSVSLDPQIKGDSLSPDTQIHGSIDPIDSQIHSSIDPIDSQIHGSIDPIDSQLHGSIDPIDSQIHDNSVKLEPQADTASDFSEPETTESAVNTEMKADTSFLSDDSTNANFWNKEVVADDEIEFVDTAPAKSPDAAETTNDDFDDIEFIDAIDTKGLNTAKSADADDDIEFIATDDSKTSGNPKSNSLFDDVAAALKASSQTHTAKQKSEIPTDAKHSGTGSGSHVPSDMNSASAKSETDDYSVEFLEVNQDHAVIAPFDPSSAPRKEVYIEPAPDELYYDVETFGNSDDALDAGSSQAQAYVSDSSYAADYSSEPEQMTGQASTVDRNYEQDPFSASDSAADYSSEPEQMAGQAHTADRNYEQDLIPVDDQEADHAPASDHVPNAAEWLFAHEDNMEQSEMLPEDSLPIDISEHTSNLSNAGLSKKSTRSDHIKDDVHSQKPAVTDTDEEEYYPESWNLPDEEYSPNLVSTAAAVASASAVAAAASDFSDEDFLPEEDFLDRTLRSPRGVVLSELELQEKEKADRERAKAAAKSSKKAKSYNLDEVLMDDDFLFEDENTPNDEPHYDENPEPAYDPRYDQNYDPRYAPDRDVDYDPRYEDRRDSYDYDTRVDDRHDPYDYDPRYDQNYDSRYAQDRDADYDPRYDQRNDSYDYDSRYDDRRDPYDYDPRYDQRNDSYNYDPRYDKRGSYNDFDPRYAQAPDPGYNSHYDDRRDPYDYDPRYNQNYDPRYDQRRDPFDYDPRYDQNYDPRYDHNRNIDYDPRYGQRRDLYDYDPRYDRNQDAYGYDPRYGNRNSYNDYADRDPYENFDPALEPYDDFFFDEEDKLPVPAGSALVNSDGLSDGLTRDAQQTEDVAADHSADSDLEKNEANAAANHSADSDLEKNGANAAANFSADSKQDPKKMKAAAKEQKKAEKKAAKEKKAEEKKAGSDAKKTLKTQPANTASKDPENQTDKKPDNTIAKKSGKKLSRRGALFILLGVCLLLLIGFTVFKIYMNVSYQPLQDISSMDTSKLNIDITDNMIEVRNPQETRGESKAGIIFYPAVRVDGECYLPLMISLANLGYDCFLPKASGNQPLLNVVGADTVIRKYTNVKKWYVAGHSDACMPVTLYAQDHPDALSGLIFLGGVSQENISELVVPLLSVIGTEDGIITSEILESSKSFNPQDTEYKSLEGGNNTNFANCQLFQGDKEALITPEDQWSICTGMIDLFILRTSVE